MCDGCERDRVKAAICKAKQQQDGLYSLWKRKDINEDQKALLCDMMNLVDWDDAIHVAAPWETRTSLCGQWGRNLVPLSEPRPNGVVGCWTCLMAAEWIDKAVAQPTDAEPDVDWSEGTRHDARDLARA